MTDFAPPLSKLGDSGIGVAQAPTGGMGLALTDDGRIPDAAASVVAYTLTWECTGTAPGIGNGQLLGSCIRIGKLVYAFGRMVAGSTTTFGTGAFLFGLPVTASSSVFPPGNALLFDTSAGAIYQAVTTFDTANRVSVWANDAGGAITPAIPFTWATGDTINFTHIYMAA